MEAAVIIVCLLFSAFFSGMEIAYVSSNKVYLSVESKQATLISRVLTRLTENPTRFVTSMLMGNSIALVLYGYFMGNAVLRWFSLADSGLMPFWQIIIQVAVATFIILITAEFIPKVFFQIYANQLIKTLSLPAYFFYVLFSYVSKAFNAVADFILVNIFGTKGDMKQAYFTKGELGTYINEQLTAAETEDEVDSEIQIFKNALEFAKLKARDIMTPRAELAAIELNDSLQELRDLFVDTGYSKIVVYDGVIDNIVGYVHSFALFKNPQSIGHIMVSTEHVPETIYIKELLNILTRKRKSMAVILDEYGGTAGIVTLEDIVEELFGEIEDEHDDEEQLTEQALEKGGWLFSARLDVDYLNENYNLKLPESDSYSTLGGLLVYHAGEIPAVGARVTAGGFLMIVEEASGKKIELIKIIPSGQK